MRGAIEDRSICTSHVDRNNGTIRTFMKRFFRLTNALEQRKDGLKVLLVSGVLVIVAVILLYAALNVCAYVYYFVL